MRAQRLWLGLGCALALVVPAGAETESPAPASSEKPYPARVWVGAFFPVAATGTDAALDLGGSVQFWRPTSRSAMTISADWTQVKGSRGTANLFPVLVNYRLQSGWGQGPLGTWRLYGGPGAGVRYTDKALPEMRIDRDWMFAWQVAAGLEWRSGWLAEARFVAGERPGDDGLFGIAGGYRF